MPSLEAVTVYQKSLLEKAVSVKEENKAQFKDISSLENKEEGVLFLEY